MATDQNDRARRFGRGVRDFFTSMGAAEMEEGRRLAPTMQPPAPGTTPYERFVGGLSGDDGPQTPLRVPANIEEAAAAPRVPPQRPTGVPTIQEAAAWQPPNFEPPDPRKDLTLSIPWATPQAKDAFERASRQREEERRTIRQMPDGTFTNVGTGGNVVMRNGQSVGPDIGAPGRGGVSFPGGNDDEAYANYRRNLMGDAAYAQEQAGTARNEMLARDPMAVERFSIEKHIAMQDAQARASTARDDARRDYVRQLVAGEAQRQIEELRQHPRYQASSPIERAAAERNIMAEAEERLLQAETNPRAFGEGLGG